MRGEEECFYLALSLFKLFVNNGASFLHRTALLSNQIALEYYCHSLFRHFLY